jgi:stress-induced morphogen
VKRHRMVYAAVDALMSSDIHALSIDAREPAQS